MKGFLIFIVVVGVLLYISVSFRIDEYKNYKKYNNMHGVVIDNFVSQGRYSSISIPTIRLDDGTVGNIKGGYHTYKIGDSFINICILIGSLVLMVCIIL